MPYTYSIDLDIVDSRSMREQRPDEREVDSQHDRSSTFFRSSLAILNEVCPIQLGDLGAADRQFE